MAFSTAYKMKKVCDIEQPFVYLLYTFCEPPRSDSKPSIIVLSRAMKRKLQKIKKKKK